MKKIIIAFMVLLIIPFSSAYETCDDDFNDDGYMTKRVELQCKLSKYDWDNNIQLENALRESCFGVVTPETLYSLHFVFQPSTIYENKIFFACRHRRNASIATFWHGYVTDLDNIELWDGTSYTNFDGYGAKFPVLKPFEKDTKEEPRIKITF